MSDLPNPINRFEQYLNAIASGNSDDLPTPITREEVFLDYIAKNGGGGGGGGDVTGVKGNAESTYRKGNVNITPANIGLGNVDNTSDANKPVSTAQQTALNGKVDKVAGKDLSTNDYTNADKAIVDGVTSALANKANVSDIPTKTSDLSNDNGFITNLVNDLVNYYKKSETYTQAEVNALIQAVTTLDIQAVNELPTTNISTTTIYLVPKSTPSSQDVKDEYINLDGTTSGWEHIGSTEIDLSNYVTTSDLTTALSGKVDKVTGKGLSTNDYTDADKAIVDGVTSGLASKVNTSAVGVANGVAELDANGRVPSAQLPSYVKIVKLWENPNPTANFEPQTITLASDDYDFFLCILKWSLSVNRQVSGVFMKGIDAYVSSSSHSGTDIQIFDRLLAYVSDTQLSISNASRHIQGSAQTTENDRFIPIVIYGIKL